MLEPTQRSAWALAASTSTSSFNEWRIIIIVPLVVLSFLSTALLAKTPIALAYSCGNRFIGPHCYGIDHWHGPDFGFTGSQTTETVANLSCTGGCVNDGFLNNEMWLFDDQTNACTSNQFKACWVEIGYKNDGVEYGGSTLHFWGDIRPGDTGINYYPIGVTTYSQVVYTIESLGNNEFQVGYVNRGGCISYCNYYAYSVNNSMQADGIQIGQELAGSTGGASASRADFTNNNYQVSLSGRWYSQTDPGDGVFSQSPPYADWVNPGGAFSNDFYTYCC